MAKTEGEVRVKISAKDQASKKIGGVANAIKGLVAAYISIRGITMVVRQMKEMINLAGKQEQAEKRVTAALKSTGNAVGYTVEELKKLATEMQNVTMYGDETILSAQALGLTFTAIGHDVFPDFIQASADMATAMKTDIRSAVLQLGKALQDPDKGLGALGRVGINVTELGAKFTATMPIMEKQRLILEELSNEFGGMAEAMGRTFQGRITQIGNLIGDAKEKIGMAIVSSEGWKVLLTGIKNSLADLNSFLTINKDKIQKWGKSLALTAIFVGETFADLFHQIIEAGAIVGTTLADIGIVFTYLSPASADTRKEIKLMKEEMMKAGSESMAFNYELHQLSERLAGEVTDAFAVVGKEVDGLSGAGPSGGEGKGLPAAKNAITLLNREFFRTSHLVSTDFIPGIEEVRLTLDEASTSALVMFESLREGAFNFSVYWTDTIIDSIVEANKSFADFAKNFMKEIAKMIMRMIMMKALMSIFGFKEGGLVGSQGAKALQHGGYVTGAGGVDKVPARLTAGEYVINKDAVNRIGVGNLERMNRGGTYNNSFSVNINVGSSGNAGYDARILGQKLEEYLRDLTRRRKLDFLRG